MSEKKLDWTLDEFVAERRRVDKRFRELYDDLDESERATLNEAARTIKELVALRKKRGLTQRQVAEAMGVTQPYVSRIERGTGPIGLRVAAAYALAVGGRISVVAESRAKYGGRT